MLTKFKIPGVRLPDLFLAHDNQEAEIARNAGFPYMKVPRDWDDSRIIALIMYDVCCKLFPRIDWGEVLGASQYTVDRLKMDTVVHVNDTSFRDTGVNHTHDIDANMDVTRSDETDDYRVGTDGGEEESRDLKEINLGQYLGTEWQDDVNLDVLQNLDLMPSFLDDIADSVRRNLSSMRWQDGWNKKLGAPMGSMRPAIEAPNLMILDVSGSIPGGVALTMVKLIDTLRTQANADLIITGDSSWWYPIGSELPNPGKLADMIGGCNEVKAWCRILRDHVAGRKFGNLIVFGDDDSPMQKRFIGKAFDGTDAQHFMATFGKSSGTTFDNILAFHTYRKRIPGYGCFAQECSPGAHVTVNNEWRNTIW